MLERYGKAASAVIYLGLVTAYAALSGDGRIEPDEWVAVAIAGTNGVLVFIIPLAPQYRWTKSAVNVVLGVLQVLATVILGGLDSGEWILLVLTGAQLLSGGLLPARSDNGVASGRPAGRPDAGPPPAL